MSKCNCPNLCRTVDVSHLDGRHPEDGKRMHPAYGCYNTAQRIVEVRCPTEGCVEEDRFVCEDCIAQYRRWLTTWEFVECMRCKRFYDCRDYWKLPPKEQAA